MKNGDVRPISRSVTETIQDRFIVLMKDKNPYAIYRMVAFPMTLTDPRGSRCSSTSNNSKMADDIELYLQ